MLNARPALYAPLPDKPPKSAHGGGMLMLISELSAVPSKKERQMTPADKYRARADHMERAIKSTSGRLSKAIFRKKQTALRDLANTEDWLDGKAPPEHEK